MNSGVHEGHCCKWHGCKYADADCPVEFGKAVQEHPCIECDDLWDEYVTIKWITPEWFSFMEGRR